MKFHKKELNKLFIVRWEDARAGLTVSLAEFVKYGFAMKETVGWLKYYDKEKIIVATERTLTDEDEFDLTIIPRRNITEMQEL